MSTTNLWVPETLGSFALDTLAITLSGECPKPAALESVQGTQRSTLEHEFGHLLHYTNTYLGLRHLAFLADLADGLRLRALDGETPEAHYTRRSERALLIYRLRQTMTIDDEYYFYGARPDLADEAAQRGHGAWCTSDGVGHLYHTDGTVSDRAFWYVKFHLDEMTQERCFARVPAGMRVCLEHMARAIDLAVDLREAGPDGAIDVFNRAVRLAYHPGNLHYCALTHLSGLLLEQKYGRSSVVLAPVLAGMLVLHLCDIPFDDGETWSCLRETARAIYPSLCDHMKYPHPSFLFPLLRRAFLQADISADSIAELDCVGLGQTLDAVLGVRSNGEATLSLRTDLARRFRNLGLSAVSDLLEWSGAHFQALAPAERLSNPTRGLAGALPVPLLFERNGGIEGTVLKMDDCFRLAGLHSTIAAQLRYPFIRNIVPL